MPHIPPQADRRPEPAAQPPARSGVIELVLAESYPLLLEGMQSAFTFEAGFRVLAACADGDEALRAVGRHHPDVLVMDLEIPGDALRILGELSGKGLPTHVVLYAASLDEAVMLEAMRLGAKGIVLKTMSRHLLVQCVRKVHRGGTWVEKVSMSRAVDELLRYEAAYRDAAAVLSVRELEVIRMVASGQSNKEIADQLAVSHGTVKVHLHHVYQKLGVKGRLELALYAREKGLFSSLAPGRPRQLSK